MAGHDAGVQVDCPGCGLTVMQKAMIPLLGDDGQGVRYLCVPCARLLVATSPSRDNGTADAEGAEEVVSEGPAPSA